MIRLIHFIILILTLLTYLPPWVNPDLSWPITTLGLLSPTLWLTTLFFTAYWLYKKDRRAWWSGFVLLLGWSMINNAFAIPDGGSEPTMDDISIATLNGHGFRIYGEAAEKRAAQEAMVRFIDSLDVDLFCVQEFYTNPRATGMIKQIKTKTDLQYSYRDPVGRLAIFSRFPLKNGEVTYFSNGVNGYLQVDVEAPKGLLHLCSIHLQTNAISEIAQSVANSPDIREENTRRRIKTMFDRYGKSNKTRTEQSREILEKLSAVKHPIIISGDFNEVPSSYLYQLFREDYQDAHLAQSWGLGTTFGGLLPGLRIDYILPDYSFQILDYEQYPCWFSDHDAIKAVIRQ